MTILPVRDRALRARAARSTLRMTLPSAGFAIMGLLSVGFPAHAEAETGAACVETPEECGRQAFDAGVQAYQRADYVIALDRFREAFRYKPHPAVALNLALAESKNGMLLEALKRFDDVLAHPDASDPLKETARQERQTVEGNVAVLVLEVDGLGSISATVDDVVMEGSPPTARLNPGTHRVLVVDDDRVLLERTVTLAQGERLRIAVQRSSEVKVVVPPVRPDPPPKQRGVDPTWFYASAGLTLGFGVLSLWSGLDTQSAFDDYERDLPTLPQDEIDRRVDAGHSKETRTNVLLGVTTLAAAGTAVLGIWVVDWEGGGASEAGNVAVTPGGLLVRGSF